MKLFRLMMKNLWRNKVRTILTSLAVFVLVMIFSMIVSVLLFLDDAMTEKSKDVRVVVTERYRLRSSFDRQYMDRIVKEGQLHEELTQISGFHPENYATWNFVPFSEDSTFRDPDKSFFAIAIQPEKIKKMVDNMEDFDPRLAELVKNPPGGGLPNSGLLMGPERLKRLGRKVGERIEAVSRTLTNGKTKAPIKMQFTIVGELPAQSRWVQGAFMDVEYLNRVLDKEESEVRDKVNLGWLMLDDQASTSEALREIDEDAVVGKTLKSETAATAMGRFLEPLKDLLWGVKWLLVPAIIVVMMVIVSSSISITVRERTQEIAVMKVLGFSKRQILVLVLGEGLLLGIGSGLLSAVLTYVLVNNVVGGIPIQFGFIPLFFISKHILWMGPLLGGLAAFVGGVIPALGGCRVKVSEVFSKVT